MGGDLAARSDRSARFDKACAARSRSMVDNMTRRQDDKKTRINPTIICENLRAAKPPPKISTLLRGRRGLCACSRSIHSSAEWDAKLLRALATDFSLKPLHQTKGFWLEVVRGRNPKPDISPCLGMDTATSPRSRRPCGQRPQSEAQQGRVLLLCQLSYITP